MSQEYKPTKKMENHDASSWDDPYSMPEGGAHEYNPTVRMNQNSASPSGYGSTSQMNQTIRLKREPPTFAWLVIIDGVHAGHVFHLHPDNTVIGRDPSCDIVIDDPSMSRQHAKVRVVEDEDKKKQFVLHDLATENGTLLNDVDIVKHELEDGDLILVGQTRLVFKQVQL